MYLDEQLEYSHLINNVGVLVIRKSSDLFILSRFVEKVASQQLSGSERLTAQGHVFISFFTKIFRGRHNLNNILRCLELY